jgi:hypothetical protein
MDGQDGAKDRVTAEGRGSDERGQIDENAITSFEIHDP